MTERQTEIINDLKLGNHRYVAGEYHPDLFSQRRRSETSEKGQEPKALVIGCSDSRVPLEIVLGQGIGDVFVVRTAGNLCGTFGLASLEFAVEVLHVQVLVVLGHTQCGAVKAAINPHDYRADRIEELLYRIQPAVLEARRLFPDLNDDQFYLEAVRANARASLDMILRYSGLIRDRIKEGRLYATIAVLDIETGKIEWF